jgi:hypothetical protein
MSEPLEPAACTYIDFPLLEGARRCGTARGATVRGGLAKLISIGRSWVVVPAAAAAAAPMPRLQQNQSGRSRRRPRNAGRLHPRS